MWSDLVTISHDRADHRRRRAEAVGLPARRQAADLCLGDADCARRRGRWRSSFRATWCSRRRSASCFARWRSPACCCCIAAGARAGRARAGSRRRCCTSPKPPKPVAESRPHVHVDDRSRATRSAGSPTRSTRWPKKVELSRLDLELRVETRTVGTARGQPRARSVQLFGVARSARAAARDRRLRADPRGGSRRRSSMTAARRYLERVKVNARRMGQLIDDLLAFSRIGRTAMLQQTTSISRAMATAVAHEADRRLGRDDRSADRDRCRRATASRRCSTRCSCNLVSNAVKFTAKVRTRAITDRLDQQSTARRVYFVRDNGVGFDERYAEKLFGVFQRLHRADEFEGTGVGLAIVHRDHHPARRPHLGRRQAERQARRSIFTLPSLRPAEASRGQASRHRERFAADRLRCLIGASVAVAGLSAQRTGLRVARTAQGHSAGNAVLPLEWSETRNLAWKTPVAGLGWSSPVVANGSVMARRPPIEQTRHFAARDRVRRRRPDAKSSTSRCSRSRRSPRHQSQEQLGVADADRRRRSCLRALRRRRHRGARRRRARSSGRTRFDYQSQHGAGGSPIVYGDLLIFSCDGSDVAFVIALDKRTGKTKWKTNRGYAVRSGVHDAARDPRRRSRSADQRRRVPRARPTIR